MNKLIKKSLRGYLTPCDEGVLSTLLRGLIPEIRFVDGQIWEHEHPPLQPSVEACSSRSIYLYDHSFTGGHYASSIGEDGKYRGRAYHSVMLARSYFFEDALMNFELPVCYDSIDEGMNTFVKKVWRALKKIPVVELKYVDGRTLTTLNPSSKAQIVGADAAARCLEGLRLKHTRDHHFWTLK